MVTSRPIRVLMILGNMGFGGSQAVAVNIEAALNGCGFEFDYAVTDASREGYYEAAIQRGCQIFTLPKYGPLSVRAFKMSWDALLANQRYDIVHVHATGAALPILKIAQKYNIATIAHSHSAGYRGSFSERLVKKMLARKVGDCSDCWLACSGEAATRLFGPKCFTDSRYRKMPNFINVKNYAYNESIRMETRESLGLESGQFLVGHIGSFSAPKNHRFIIDVFAEVIKLEGSARLLFVGEGPLKENAISHAKDIGILPYCIFAGERQDINALMMAMDVMLFPSLFEGFPVAVLEAQATGLRVVMSDTVTEEVCITECVTRASLKESPQVWAERVLRETSHNRPEMNMAVLASAYSQERAIPQIQQIYCELYKKKHPEFDG